MAEGYPHRSRSIPHQTRSSSPYHRGRMRSLDLLATGNAARIRLTLKVCSMESCSMGCASLIPCMIARTPSVDLTLRGCHQEDLNYSSETGVTTSKTQNLMLLSRELRLSREKYQKRPHLLVVRLILLKTIWMRMSLSKTSTIYKRRKRRSKSCNEKKMKKS